MMPWLNLPLTFGDTTFPQAGIVVQTGIAAFLVLMTTFVAPSHRVSALERSHRDFAITMSDVAEAYRVCHAADRADAFTMSEQFDQVKERIQFLRRHPDLGNLEPEVMEAAAEMSTVSHELAETYSDENVTRAERFLKSRQEEIETFQARIENATAQAHRLRRWLDQVEMEEATAESQLRQLEEQLGDTLEYLGFTRRQCGGDDSAAVIKLPHVTAAE
ncbi:hypothetical protein SAMN04490244_106226 [Tranquillimonas rosea]|uniref:DNA repair protein n=1 Tax=Tranquillimonas rosea TaxID=641238 RepID=A0A1H9V432_9RHOB|nr:hypothetical protein [Tranquillimonas rosea]SES16311.1 hypothetical protein SAMN04490244_106226 [Tranquillimonas rosea]